MLQKFKKCYKNRSHASKIEKKALKILLKCRTKKKDASKIENNAAKIETNAAKIEKRTYK